MENLPRLDINEGLNGRLDNKYGDTAWDLLLAYFVASKIVLLLITANKLPINFFTRAFIAPDLAALKIEDFFRVKDAPVAVMILVSLAVSVAGFLVIFKSAAYYYNKRHPLEFLPCPYRDCNKSVRIYDAWKCDHCHNRQKAPKHLSEKCDYCEREISTAFCEHCNREFYL